MYIPRVFFIDGVCCFTLLYVSDTSLMLCQLNRALEKVVQSCSNHLSVKMEKEFVIPLFSAIGRIAESVEEIAAGKLLVKLWKMFLECAQRFVPYPAFLSNSHSFLISFAFLQQSFEYFGGGIYSKSCYPLPSAFRFFVESGIGVLV